MRPLECLQDEPVASPVARLLREAPPAEVRREIERLDALSLDGALEAARNYAHGALALREGRLDEAHAQLDIAAEKLAAAGLDEAAALSRCECWLAAIRRGPRKVVLDAIEALAAIAGDNTDSRVVWVVASHYRATAMRYSGHAEGTLQVLLEAFAASDGLLMERAQVLNSLGTLYVVLGAFGAAGSVLSHAAELNHQIGDRVSEAISYGQLGSAAMGRGELEEARRYLQRQEWFASQVGDNFGRARALVLLGDLAIDLGRPDDAVELASRARDIASSVTPPLNMWIGYATRTIGRAKVELGDKDAAAELAAAAAQFQTIGNQLGDALVNWDMAHLAAKSRGLSDRDIWHETAEKLALLGLTSRVAQVMHDFRDLVEDEDEAKRLDLAIAAASQSFAHLASAQEIELVLSKPDTVAALATRRIGGQRNLARLAAHTLARPGLSIAVIAAEAIGTGARPLPSGRSAAALLGQLPGVALWSWLPDVSEQEIARDLSSLRVSLGEDSRVVLGSFPEARVVAIPFAGELGVEIAGADLGAHVAAALRADPGSLSVLEGTAWDGEAEALARMSGFTTNWQP